MKPLRVILAVCAVCGAGLLMLGLVVGSAASNPVDPAKAAVVGKGWRPEQLGLRDYQMSSGLLGGTARVQFNAKRPGESKTVRVDLVRPAWSSDWRVSGYEERGAN